MTPQERKLIEELFDRLASLEGAPRDADAVQSINEGVRRAPNALYPLVQTALVQDEALKRADARIRELEDELGVEPGEPVKQAGFLDNMRDALLGKSHGSVPSVRPGAPGGSPWGNTASQGYAPQPGAAAPPPGSAGGSFLGTAAASAAGVVGGALLMNSFRGMFGGQQGQAQAQGNRAFDQGGGGSPWNPSGGDLARQAGVDDIGRGGERTSAYDAGDSQRQGAFDVAQNDATDAEDSDFDNDDDFDLGGDTDTA